MTSEIPIQPMTWQNPTTRLWYTVMPTPGTIVFDGTNYNLYIPAIGDGILSSSNVLEKVQGEYAIRATQFLAKNITLVPSLPSLSLPADGDLVGVATTSGLIVVGVWSAENQNVTVAACVIPLADIVTWSPIPTLSFK
jgi:hypothetical protein